MRKISLFILGLVLISLLSYICFNSKADDIRKNLVSNVTSALATKNFEAIKPSVKGFGQEMTRIITLKGVVPSEDLKLEAQRVAESANGVYAVDNQLVVEHLVNDVEKISQSPEVKIAKVTVPEVPIVEKDELKAKIDEVFPIEPELIPAPAPIINSVAPEMEHVMKEIKVEQVKFEPIEPELIPVPAPVINSVAPEVKKDTEPVQKLESAKSQPEKIIFSCQNEFEKILSSSKIKFDSGKSEINPDSYLLLDSLVEVSKKCPNDAIAIGGHTDSSGSDSLNQKLSAARAEAVRRYLIGHGISKDRLVSIGYGETRPIADNSTDEGRALNRRIDFKVIDMDKVKSLSAKKEKITITSELKEINSMDDMGNTNSNVVNLSNIPLAKTIRIDAQTARKLGAASLGQSFEDLNVEPSSSIGYSRNDRGNAISYQNKIDNLFRGKKINFAYNKAKIKEDSFDLLDKFVKIIRDCNNCIIIISGHTDSDGSATFNKRLSLKRANAVKEYLVKKGISSDRLQSVGYGGMYPIADNNSEEGKEKNRRIEFHIKGVR